MTRKISDLLDDYSAQELNMELETPLSLERIRELTMSKVKENRKTGRIARRILIAAAMIMAMAVTVFAAGNGLEWFREYFGRNSKTELTEGQLAFVDENYAEANRSQTIDGYTVTLESYVSEGSGACVKISIQAPEGREVPLKGFEFGDINTLSENGETAYGALFWDLAERNEETNSAIQMLDLTYLVLPEQHSGEACEITVELTDLYDSDGLLLAEGTWRFEIEIEDHSMELLEEPIVTDLIHNAAGDSVEVTVGSACLRSTNLRLTFEPPAVEMTAADYNFWSVTAVMQDGTTVELLPAGWGRESDEEGALCWVDYYGGIVPMDEVAYIELHSGVQIPVNE